jgi:hypothetical protein
MLRGRVGLTKIKINIFVKHYLSKVQIMNLQI